MSGLIWDKGNRKHATRHGVSKAEIDEVFERPFVEIVLEIEEWDTEVQLRVLGTTARGRFVTVTFTERRTEDGTKPRPISAWPMTEEELIIYAQYQDINTDPTDETEI